jgi:hypothetical protein
MRKRKNARLVLIATLMLTVFNYPLLGAANSSSYLRDVPVLYLYIGAVWLLAILALYLTTTITGRKSRGNE